MTGPLMPKATAVWLIENTALTFEQIAVFCQLHILEVRTLAQSETGPGVVGMDPIGAGQLTQEEIARCEADPIAQLMLIPPVTAETILGKKKTKYTPVSKRQDRPDAIAWLLKYHPELTDAQIKKLVRTTKKTIDAVRLKEHWNSKNIKPQSPVQVGLCTQKEFDEEIERAQSIKEKSKEVS